MSCKGVADGAPGATGVQRVSEMAKEKVRRIEQKTSEKQWEEAGEEQLQKQQRNS